MGRPAADGKGTHREHLQSVAGRNPHAAAELQEPDFPLVDGAMPFPGWDTFEGPDSDDLDADARARLDALSRLGLAAVAALGVAVRRPGLGWLAVTFVIGALYLGALLRLPRWLIDASPVSRTTAPSSISVAALAVMTLIAVGITMIAGWLYRRRDVV